MMPQLCQHWSTKPWKRQAKCRLHTNIDTEVCSPAEYALPLIGDNNQQDTNLYNNMGTAAALLQLHSRNSQLLGCKKTR